MISTDRLKLFLEKGATLKTEKLLLLFFPMLIQKKIATRIVKERRTKKTEQIGFTHTLNPFSYTGENKPAQRIALLFQQAQPTPVYRVIVFGSIASGDENTYSDFDGAIIVDTAQIKDEKDLIQLRELIATSEVLQFKQDSLQHHGWHIFTLEEFLHYPDATLPLEILQTGKTLYPKYAEPIHVNCIQRNADYTVSFRNLTQSLLRKCDNRPGDLYALKVLLSEIMLLPACFLQAKHHRGFMKKDSFTLFYSAYPHIDPSLLREVSHWRENWSQPELNKRLFLFHRLRKSGIYLSVLAPGIPLFIKERLTPAWYQRLITLCREMENELSTLRPV